MAFKGCSDENHYILVKNCTNHLKKDYWFYNNRTYVDHFALLKHKHPGWDDEFANAKPPS